MVTELERNLAQRYTGADLFKRNARLVPNKIALVEKRGDVEYRITYKELNSQINRFATALKSLGYQQKDSIALLGMNSFEFIISLFGCARGGFVAVPLNPGMSSDDIVYMMNDSDSKALVADDLFSPLVDKIKDKCPAVNNYVVLPVTGSKASDYFIDFNNLLEKQSDDDVEVVIWERETFGIFYTSGTTSRPKGTVVSHLSIVMATMTNMIDVFDFKDRRNVSSIMVMPAFHAAQSCINLSLFMGEGKIVIFRAFEPTLLLQTVEKEKIRLLFLLPLMWSAIVNHPQLNDFDISSIVLGIYAMAPMDKPTLEKIINKITDNIILATGQTEFTPSTENFKKQWQLSKTGNYWGEPAITVETVIMDKAGKILPQGEVGEIVRRGPGALTEYLGNPEATNEKLKYGWAHSEDIGYFDEDGLLVFVDRTKDMIKTGGENVPSIKVEQVILALPKIAEVAVIGLPHDRWSEAITAFVVLVEGEQMTEEEIIAHCKKELGGFEVPKKVLLVDVLPKTITGKLRKNVIKAEHIGLYN